MNITKSAASVSKLFHTNDSNKLIDEVGFVDAFQHFLVFTKQNLLSSSCSSGYEQKGEKKVPKEKLKTMFLSWNIIIISIPYAIDSN